METNATKFGLKIRSNLMRLAMYVLCILTLVLINNVFADVAFGAPKNDWAKPITNVIGNIQAGLLLIGGGLMAVAVGIVAIGYYFQPDFQIKRVYPIFIGGGLLFFGGTAVKTLFN